ncbi:MAG TPA: type VI secretion system protein TssA [Thermoanaerobaculia bacterium]|nr:type VI secretion system protein TssA [Thermoanaerobaculia bacterium]
MPSAPVFNLDALLAPIAGEKPCGENLQYSGLHDEIREARRADDDVPQGDWVHELKVADWEKVAELAGESLASKTKDLQIVAWLSEAAVNMHGFPGLRDSLKLATGYLGNFWDALYPEIDEGNDLEARANAIAWMDRQAAEAVRKVPLTKRSGANYNFFQWDEALQYDFPADTSKLSSEALAQLEEKRARAQAEGKITGEEVRKAKSETRRAFYEELFADVADCWSALKALDKEMDARFARQTPGLGNLTKSLDAIRTLLEKVVKEKRIEEPDPSDATEGAEGEAAAGGGGGPGGTIRARDQALAQLAQVADYFRRTEPHSPVSYLVQRAIAWGQMPLDAWLVDVIKDTNVLAGLRETLGLKDESGGTGT